MGSQFSHIDLGFLKKYDRPGPRYTSYPTAPLFSAAFTAADFAAEIRATNRPDTSTDLSLYFHFPFCDTLCYFCGCTMLVTQDRFRIENIPCVSEARDRPGGAGACPAQKGRSDPLGRRHADTSLPGADPGYCRLHPIFVSDRA